MKTKILITIVVIALAGWKLFENRRTIDANYISHSIVNTVIPVKTDNVRLENIGQNMSADGQIALGNEVNVTSQTSRSMFSLNAQSISLIHHCPSALLQLLKVRKAKPTNPNLIPGIKIQIALSDLMGNIDEAPIQYHISGTDIDSVKSAAGRILENMSSIRGLIDTRLSVEGGSPEISIIPDRNKMSSLGLTLIDLGLALNNAFGGNTEGKFRSRENEYDISILLDRSDRKNVTDVENFSIGNAHDQMVKLKQFATIEETEGATILERRNRAPSITISGMQ
jgi:Cation/multidrug efflux pump